MCFLSSALEIFISGIVNLLRGGTVKDLKNELNFQHNIQKLRESIVNNQI